MHPDRFLNLCFVYLGLSSLAVFALAHQFDVDGAGMTTLLIGVAALALGLYRIAMAEEPRVTEYGPVVYFIALLCVTQTIRVLIHLL